MKKNDRRKRKLQEEACDYEIERTPTTRYEPDYEEGLTSAQAEEHRRDGWGNISVDPPAQTTEEIIKEIQKLAADGVVEIMLLGQNVNSYGKNLDNPMTFAQLLEEVEKIDGIERIRFMTSHPKDLSDELIEVMARSEKIC